MIIPVRRVSKCAGIACATAVLVGVAGCGTVALAPADPAPATPADRSCWPQGRYSNEEPFQDSSVTAGFSAVPGKASGGLSDDRDAVEAQEVITDFPQPPNAQVTDPAQNAVVLVSFKVKTTHPAGWEPGKSVVVIAYEDLGERGTLWKPICPANPSEVADLIRAGGREPLPARVEPGQSATGWAAFIVPRTSTALTLRVQRIDPTQSTWSGGPLMRPATPAPHAAPAPGASG